MNQIYRSGIFLSVAGALFLWAPLNAIKREEDACKNTPELSLPLLNKKMVIAHCMTNIIRYKGHKMEDSCNPDYYAAEGNITAPLGGLTQVNVIADKFLSDKTLDEAVEFEMRTALKMGIDGFQFYYTLGSTKSDEIIKAYFRVATKKNIDFKFTFCVSHPSGGTEDSRIAGFGNRMKNIFDEVGKDNPHWLRTPDGRLILYTWYGDALADIPKEENEKFFASKVANAYKKLEGIVEEKFAVIISINEMISEKKLNDYLDYFPAVWLWTLPYTKNYIGEKVATICKKRGRTFTGSAFPGFYTSKLLKRGTWDMYHRAEDAVKAGMDSTERKYIVTGLTYNFRKQLEFALSKDVTLINIITWNDYPEGHHLAPEVNHNDGFSILLRHYKNIWKKDPSPFNTDVVIAFYKKYKHNIQPSPFYYPIIEIEKRGVPIETEDSIDVVTILKQNSQLVYNGVSKDVAAGMQSTKFAATAGAVTISLQQNGKEKEKLVCPEWITDKPYRTDRLTYSFSNQTQKTYREMFGDEVLPSSQEYNAFAKGNAVHLYTIKK